LAVDGNKAPTMVISFSEEEAPPEQERKIDTDAVYSEG